MGTSMGTQGPAPLSAQREQFARLIARGVSNSEACRLVGVNRRTLRHQVYEGACFVDLRWLEVLHTTVPPESGPKRFQMVAPLRGRP